MKYVDEYRDPAVARQLLDEIRGRVTRSWTIMEVCGGQTHSLLRHGIDAELEGIVELIHGPGCPVCVTPLEAIDLACDLVLEKKATLASFGDMLRVPGSRYSLLQARAEGGDVQIVYSPLDAVELAQQCPEREVVFFAVGFETTAPATALAVRQAHRLGLKNFSSLVAHVRVQPAMEAIARMDDNRVQGFLAAGHVCTVMGYESYAAFSRDFRLPVVVTGFEPVDLLSGILACIEQLESGSHEVVNCYSRSVRPEGNRNAQGIVREVYQVADCSWRGLGWLPGGGLTLRSEWVAYDARRRFSIPRSLAEVELPLCRSADVLSGRIRPPECPSFGTGCTPDNPLGAPMVSSEGACAAYYRYWRAETV